MAYYKNANTLFDSEDVAHQKCSHCGVEKPLGDFNTRDSKKRLDTRCKPCKRELMKVARTLSVQKGNENKGYCDCCGVYKGRNKLRLDHDHETDAFRGWLCENCNTGIGRLGDNEEGLLKALKYLQSYRDRNIEEVKLFDV